MNTSTTIWIRLLRRYLRSVRMFLVYRLNNIMDSMFESNTFVFRDLKKSLREIIAEGKGMVTLDSQFKSIDIRDISDNYRFIGGKEQCAEFIKKSLAFMPQERCVNKTIQRTYRREDIPDAVFTKSHRDVEY